MNIAVAVILGLVLLLAPIVAAVPDEPLWSSWLMAGTLGVAAVAAWRGGGALWARPTRAEKAFLLLLGVAFLSILWRLVAQGGTGFFGPMLRGWATLAADFALFALARRASADSRVRLGLIACAVLGAVIVADIGVQEYVAHARAGQASWRIFATSTPDYLAGYFVITLPLTLALLLEAPAVRGLTPLLRGLTLLLLGVAALFQLAGLLFTGSRFALVSLAVSLIVFGVALWRASRAGYALPKASRGLIIAAGIALVLGGATLARPVLARLHNLNDNSAAFRVWTWRGSVKMAAANPVLGTGVGSWPDLYPRYALTGFTRVAHNSYLQMADECGVPGLVLLVGTLGLLGASLGRGLAVRPPEDAPMDPRLLLCGLLAGCAGSAVQNLIDSDWYVFFLGTTFWTLAGLAVSIAAPEAAAPETKRPALPVVLAVSGVAGAFALLTAGQGLAALSASSVPPDYATARTWDPLNAKYPSDEGFKIRTRQGDLSGAEADLRQAVALEPEGVHWRRLGDVLKAQGETAAALSAYQSGLRTDPNSLPLLQAAAQTAPPAQSLAYYQKMADLELSPVGTVRALGESVETRFAYADAALGDDAAAKTDPARALTYYARAADVIERFVDAGGSMNVQQQALSGFEPDPKQDAAMRDLYLHVMDARLALAPPAARPALSRRRGDYKQKLDAVLAQSSGSNLSGGQQ